jgi:hypothetical protein
MGFLRGEDEEGLSKRVGAAGDGDFVFLHRLEHRGLRFGGGAVDFVGEDDVREDGALGEFEGAFAAGEFLQNVGAGDVHGHQIGRELDAAEAQRHRFGEARDEQRLGEAGHAHEQGVTTGEEADRELLDDLVLADDDFFQRLDEILPAEAALNKPGGVHQWRRRRLTMVEAYGVWVEKSMYGKTYMGTERTTFVLDEKGIVKAIFPKVKPAEHVDLLLEALV